MAAAWGQFALYLALSLGLLSAWRGRRHPQLVFTISYGIGLLVCVSFLALVYGAVQQDISLAYVLQHTHSSLPWLYKLGAVWAGHEGSLLLWVWILSLWTVVLAWVGRPYAQAGLRSSLLALHVLLMAFIVLLLLTANPFVQTRTLLIDGLDLNPMLQDLSLLFHPPLLYIGYVGFSVCFALSIGLLCHPEFTFALVLMRRFTLVANAFLTLGICLGSYWAYYELGWGGWWFWDPVENAALLPWLLSVILLHGLARARVNDARWLSALALVVFACSLLGTFIVRSGLISSVHAFARDAQRGWSLVILMAIVLGWAVGLWYRRGRQWAMGARLRPRTWLAGMWGLAAIFLIVLLGTCYPLFHEWVMGQSLSVAPEFYQSILGPVYCGVLLMMLWGESFGFGACLALLVGLGWFSGWQLVMVALSLCLVWQSLRNRGSWGKRLGHLGVGIFTLGACVSAQYSLESSLVLPVGQNTGLGPYEIQFLRQFTREGENYIAEVGEFAVCRRGRVVARLFPEQRHYVISDISLAETAIAGGVFQDIYLALGQEVQQGQWSVRLQYKPWIRWVWVGGLLVSLGQWLALARGWVGLRWRRFHVQRA